MANILIVTDTTSGFDFEHAEKYGIELIPLSLLIDGVEYKDHIDISSSQLYQKLKEGVAPTTSQPNIGYVEAKMKEWKEQRYDAIIIVTISSHLSGTYQGFQLMVQQQEMEHVYLVDSKTVAGPMMDAVLKAKEMADQNASVEDILQMLAYKFDHTVSFLYPETLTQLKKGGRISPVAANMASLLKIKPLLMLKKDGTMIDKYGMSRTESKLFDMIKDAFEKEGIHPDTHRLYLPHAQAEDAAKRLTAYIKEHMGNFDMITIALPAVLTSHGGLGCIAIQSVTK